LVCYDNADVDISKTADLIQKGYIQKCIRLAERSSLTHKHGCVIVDTKSGDIISQGFNCILNNHVKVNSLHAEIVAIKNAKKYLLNGNECDMYVVRVGGQGNLKYSKPCQQCSFMIKSRTRIKHIYYSINSPTLTQCNEKKS